MSVEILRKCLNRLKSTFLVFIGNSLDCKAFVLNCYLCKVVANCEVKTADDL